MNSDLNKIFACKRAFRRDLAARPIAEKLRILDAMRERELAIRGRVGKTSSPRTLHEKPQPYRTKPD